MDKKQIKKTTTTSKRPQRKTTPREPITKNPLDKINFIFTYRKKGIIPTLIRWFSKGKWSHVIVEVNGNHYEAIGGRVMGINGVVAGPSPFSYHRGLYTVGEHKVVEVETKWIKQTEDFLKSQVGANYDILGFLSFGLRWIQGKAAAYYCSELGLKAYEIAVNKKYDQQYTPQELFELVK